MTHLLLKDWPSDLEGRRVMVAQTITLFKEIFREKPSNSNQKRGPFLVQSSEEGSIGIFLSVLHMTATNKRTIPEVVSPFQSYQLASIKTYEQYLLIYMTLDHMDKIKKSSRVKSLKHFFKL